MTIESIEPMRLGATRADLDTLASNVILAQLDPHELGALLEVCAQLVVTPGTELALWGPLGLSVLVPFALVRRRNRRGVARHGHPGRSWPRCC